MNKRLSVERLEDRRVLTLLSVPSMTEGAFESPARSESDFYTFEAEAGENYRITAKSTSLESLNVSLRADTPLAEPVFEATNYQSEAGAVIEWTASDSGTFELFVSTGLFSRNGNNGTYALELTTFEDDHRGSVDGAASISQSNSGVLEFQRDIDVITFEAVAGSVYDISIVSDRLLRPEVRILDASDVPLFHTDGGEFVERGGGDRFSWAAPADGTYGLEFRSNSAFFRVHEYAWSVEPVSYDDDHGNIADTATVVAGSAMGVIERAGDVDFFSFEATAGEQFRFSTTADDLDSRLRVFDASGASQLASSGSLTGSPFVWTAPNDGTYVVEMSASVNSESGGYELLIDPFADDHAGDARFGTQISVPGDITSEIDFAGDLDYFAFEAQVGVAYRFTAEVVGEPAASNVSLRVFDADQSAVDTSGNWTAPTDGVYFVEVLGGDAPAEYRLTIDSPNDDHGGFRDNATSVALPFAITGSTDFALDRDAFRFQAEAGSILRVVNDGSRSVSISNDNAGLLAFGTNTWLVLRDDEYVLTVRSNESGTYGVGVDLVEFADDHGNVAADATRISLPSTIVGRMDDPADHDLFVFTAEEGVVYNLTATDVELAELTFVDTDGSTVLERERGPVRFLGNPFISWRAPTSGDFFIRVQEQSENYTLRVDAPNDDQTGGSPEARPLLFSSGETGEFESLQDEDVFQFDAVAGTPYAIQLDISSSSTLRVVDRDGESILDRFETSFDGGRLRWVASENGTYFIEVQGSLTEYELSISDAAWLRCDFSHEVGCDSNDLNSLLYAGASDEEIAQWLVDASLPGNPAKENVDDVYVHGDLDLDGDVDSRDLGFLLANFGSGFVSGGQWQAGHLNSDLVVDSTDLGLLLNNLGHTSEPPAAAMAVAVESVGDRHRHADNPTVADKYSVRDLVFGDLGDARNRNRF